MPSGLQPLIWSLPLFLGLWCGIVAFLALISGWLQLSRKFPCPADFQAKQSFSLASLSLGIPYFPVAHRNCAYISIGEMGIKISIMFIFRILHPPILVPWREIESVKWVRRTWINSVIVNIRNEKRRFRFYWEPARVIFEMCKQKGIRIET